MTSATIVPAQQREWIVAELRRLEKLPTEIIDLICDYSLHLPTRAETEMDRADMMAERSVMVEANTTEIFLSHFNMWYEASSWSSLSLADILKTLTASINPSSLVGCAR